MNRVKLISKFEKPYLESVHKVRLLRLPAGRQVMLALNPSYPDTSGLLVFKYR